MSSADKLLDAMRANPRDWRIADVERVCAGCGIACLAPGNWSHYKLKHRSIPMILTIPAHRPIKPVYIRAFVGLVDAVREASA